MSFRTLCLAAVLAVGCVPSPSDTESDGVSTFAVSMSPADSQLVLDLVNYPGVGEIDLDDVVGLDTRAAQNIQAHRAGADGVFPSNDDNYFDDVAELDALAYVGDVAFQKLLSHAHSDPAPAGEIVESVSFRGWESEIVVWGVNSVSLAVLDGMLDARAAENLVATRPFASVTQMGPVGYVGTSALERLRTEAPAWWAARSGSSPLAGTFDGVAFDEQTAQIALDIANQATYEQMVENAVYANGAAAIVGNRPYTSLAGVAGVSGVGTATMQDLHDYAVSGAWVGGGGGSGGGGGTHTPPNPNCVFGLTYRDIFTIGSTIVIAKRVLDPSSSTNATQRAQIVAAVQAADPNVTTVSQAFAAADGNQINHLELWDASNRDAYTAYEFGAGDNSYGRVFAYGTTTVATNIIDGDLYDCTAMWGPEMQTCPTNEDCAVGHTCVGINPDISAGRCIDLQAPAHPQEGNDCSYELGCMPESGLVCAGAATWGTGICVPAWMRGYFEQRYENGVAIPDGSTTGITLELPAFGLASVDTDVLLDLDIDHTNPANVRVWLTNPAGAQVLIFDGPGGWPATQLNRKSYVVHGFSGDEMVNGQWSLKVVDVTSGNTGTVHRFGLSITSRWD